MIEIESLIEEVAPRKSQWLLRKRKRKGKGKGKGRQNGNGREMEFISKSKSNWLLRNRRRRDENQKELLSMIRVKSNYLTTAYLATSSMSCPLNFVNIKPNQRNDFEKKLSKRKTRKKKKKSRKNNKTNKRNKDNKRSRCKLYTLLHKNRQSQSKRKKSKDQYRMIRKSSKRR